MAKAKVIKIPARKSAKEEDYAKQPVELNADYYEKLVRDNPLNQKAYNRLMIIYRKEKNHKKELQVINKAIREFEKFNKSIIKKKSKKITSLSKGLNKQMGLVGPQGKPVYDPEPLSTWKKRREVVLRKLGKHEV